jgi:hypothetical protein
MLASRIGCGAILQPKRPDARSSSERFASLDTRLEFSVRTCLATSLSRFSSRCSSACYLAPSVLERKTEGGEERLALFIGLGRRGDADIETTQGINLVVFNFRENNLPLTPMLIRPSKARPEIPLKRGARKTHKDTDNFLVI